MPCSDVTEIIEVVLDSDDRLREYRFAKRTCGQGVGAESLLIDQLRGRSLAELLTFTADQFLAEFSIPDETEEFLSLKHLFAIQSALEVLTGKEPGRRDDPFAAGEIEFGEGETRISGRIIVDIVTERIKACGGCGSCGTSSPKAEQGKLENAVRRHERGTATAIA
ncbi:MAG: hypothetical protein AAB353_07870 [Candidatus Hydrogenedentota bacterium]